MGFEERTNSNLKLASVNDNRYVFDDFEVDTVNRTCARAGEPLPITGKVFDILAVFIENPGRLLSKDELLDRVWPNEFVEEGNLARNVSTLRRALGDNGKDHKYILTVPGHGYRFLPEVVRASAPGVPETASEVIADGHESLAPLEGRDHSNRWVLLVVAGLTLLTAAWFGSERFLKPADQIKNLVVMPLKSLDSGDSYLGVGIANAVIQKVSQSHQLTVKPTSAILRYATENSDALAAAKELNADAVLDGTVQRSGDRLRVSINLLRTADGTSLWAESFEMANADIFEVQDRVAQQVANRLQLHLDSGREIAADKKYPANPTAYEFYIKGIISLDQRGYYSDAMPQMLQTIDLLNKSIEADPNYALSHAQLGWAYTWIAEFMDASDPKWADLARKEIERADVLDPDIAETHLDKAVLYWSRYENYQYDAIIKELKIAHQLNPNTTHGEAAGIYGHLGLEEQALNELKQAREVDPGSQALKELEWILPALRGDADAWFEAIRTRENNSPYTYFGPWYYLRKGDLETAKKAIDEQFPKGQKYPDFQANEALYWSLKGDFSKAQSMIDPAVEMIPLGDHMRHHLTYDAACVYAIGGKSGEAVKWLRETADTGYPNYPLFARDPFLDRIRQSPEFIQFLAEQKTQWERFEQEFADA